MLKNNICVSGIQSVVRYKYNENDKEFSRYGPDLYKYELVYRLSGENFTTFNGKTLHNKPNTAMLLPKGDGADYTVKRVSYGDCIDIYFDTESEMPCEALFFDLTENKRIEGLFRKILLSWVGRKEGYEYACMSILYDILFELARPYKNYIPADKYALIEKGIDYLREHCLDKEIDYYMPAQICGISYTYFKRLFISKFSVPPVKYVTKLKLEYSLELILSKRHSIGEVAQMCGFDSVYYFSKKFKENFGISPSRYEY